jgi:hypothetical protein
MRGALIAGVVLAVALAGCGGKSDEQEVRDTANGFVGAVHAGDGKKACSLLTEESKPIYSQLGDIPCEQGVIQAAIPAGVKIYRVRITGDRATVGLRNRGGELRQLTLKRRGGGWRVDVTAGS